MGEDRRQGGKGGQRGYFEVHIDSRALYVGKRGFALKAFITPASESNSDLAMLQYYDNDVKLISILQKC